MNKEMINIDWGLLGARLARLSTEEQIPFFKEFANEMLHYPSHYAMEMQLTMIRDGVDCKEFTREQKEVFTTLGFEGKE